MAGEIDDFRDSLDDLRSGELVDFLRRDDFPSWIDLASNQALRRLPSELGTCEPASAREEFRPKQVQTLARRLILARETSLFSALRPLWHAFGSSEAICDGIQDAIESALSDWSPEVIQIGGDSATAVGFSAGCADFVKDLRQVEASDGSGALGAAIRMSRIVDERAPVGIPLVLRGESGANVSTGVWATPIPTHPQPICEVLHESWTCLWKSVEQLTSPHSRPDGPDLYLPDWLHWHVKLDGRVDTLDSAGFGLAMHLLAKQQSQPLPFALGFTGRWESGRLHGVRDLAAKMLAAKEAGVFLLFACCDPGEPQPRPIEGVRLVLLPEGLSLNSVVRLVNRVCADSGLTEFRWREASRRLRSSPAASTAHSPDLPDACGDKLCPVGFIGREQALALLSNARTDATGESGRGLLAVVGPPWSGKTTLLSRFASQESLYPIWFSFRRGQATQQTLDQLRASLSSQFAARFFVVPLPLDGSAPEDSGNASDDRMIAIVQATAGAINLVIDGVDEAQSPFESRRVLNWLQQLPGDGTVVVGLQPSALPDEFNCRRLELRNDSEQGRTDARTLIANFASRFRREDHSRSIASQLEQDRWINGLTQKAGGILGMLTDFLSAMGRDPAGWPNRPEDAPLFSNVDKYGRNLIQAVLTGYDNDERTLVEPFLAYLAFMGDRRWKVKHIVRLEGDLLASAPLRNWSGTGILTGSVQRLIECNETHCWFRSPLAREAVRNNYQNYESEVAERFIKLITNRPDELSDYAIELLPALVAEIGDYELTHRLLFDCPWLHHRIRMLAKQGNPVSILVAELDSLIRFVAPNRVSDVTHMMDWLTGWGWAIDEGTASVDQWWDQACSVTGGFSRVPVDDNESTHRHRLLAPIIGPEVDNACYGVRSPPIPDFRSAACETVDGSQSHLVFATIQGDLLVYREKNRRFVRERFIRLPETEKAHELTDHTVELVGLPYPDVAAVTNLPDYKRALRVVNVESGVSRIVRTGPIKGLGVLSAAEPLLLVIHAQRGETDSSPFAMLRVLDLNFNTIATSPLPFGLGPYSRLAVTPFGPDRWAVIGHEGEENIRKMRLYRLVTSSGSIHVEAIQEPNLQWTRGACALPNQCLAVTHNGSDDGERFLSVLDKNGTETLRTNLFYFDADADNSSFHHDPIPGGWHPQYGVLLFSDHITHDFRIFAIRLEPEAIVRKIPVTLEGSGNIRRERVLSISKGRTLVVFSRGALVLGPGEAESVSIEGGPKPHTAIEIIGCRADGRILVRDDFEEGTDERIEKRFAVPPFESESSQVELESGHIRVTRDGWELSTSDGETLEARRSVVEEPLRMKLAFALGSSNLRILDADSTGDGGFVMAVVTNEKTWLYRISGNQHTAYSLKELERQDTRLIWADADACIVESRGASRRSSKTSQWFIDLSRPQKNSHGAERIQEQTEPWKMCLVGERSIVGLERGAHVVSVLDLPDGHYLIFIRNLALSSSDEGPQRHMPVTIGILYSSELQMLSPQSELRLSTESFIYDRSQAGSDWLLRVASIGGREQQSFFELRSIRFDTQNSLLINSSHDTQVVELSGGPISWCRFDRYVVLAFDSGRIEVRSLHQPDEIAATAYAAAGPNSMTVAKLSDRVFLVVSSIGELEWFDLSCLL